MAAVKVLSMAVFFILGISFEVSDAKEVSAFFLCHFK